MRISDWSSDVCSSDLDHLDRRGPGVRQADLDAVTDAKRQAGFDQQASRRNIVNHHIGAIVGVLRTLALQANPAPGAAAPAFRRGRRFERSEEHTTELQSLMRNSYAVFCLQKKKKASV